MTATVVVRQKLKRRKLFGGKNAMEVNLSSYGMRTLPLTPETYSGVESGFLSRIGDQMPRETSRGAMQLMIGKPEIARELLAPFALVGAFADLGEVTSVGDLDEHSVCMSKSARLVLKKMPQLSSKTTARFVVARMVNLGYVENHFSNDVFARAGLFGLTDCHAQFVPALSLRLQQMIYGYDESFQHTFNVAMEAVQGDDRSVRQSLVIGPNGIDTILGKPLTFHQESMIICRFKEPIIGN